MAEIVNTGDIDVARVIDIIVVSRLLSVWRETGLHGMNDLASTQMTSAFRLFKNRSRRYRWTIGKI